VTNMHRNEFIYNLSDEQLRNLEAEQLEFQDDQALDEFFSLKLRKGILSLEMISAALDGEFNESLNQEILSLASKDPEFSKALHSLASLAIKAKSSRDTKNAALGEIVNSRNSALDTFGGPDNSSKSEQAIDYLFSLSIAKMPLDIKEKLQAQESQKNNHSSLPSFLISIKVFLKDFATPRVAGPAFASLMIGIISTSFLFERGEITTTDILPYSNEDRVGFSDSDLFFSVPEEALAIAVRRNTRGGLNTDTRELRDGELLISLQPFQPLLMQAGQAIQPRGNVEENIPWTVSAQSLLNGTASLYNVDPEGILTLLGTQPAYEKLYFTFNDLLVFDQDSLDLRLTIVSDDLTTEVTFNISYLVE
jgi:hypothetical protein